MAEDESLYCEQHLIKPLNPISSMVVIRESPIFAKGDRLVFPPVNHENLQLASSVSVSEFDNRYLESPSSESESPSSSSRGSASSSSFSLSPSDSDGQPPLSPCEFYQKLPSETTEEKSDSDGQSPPLTGSKRGGESPPPRKVLYREADDVLRHWWELLLVRAYSKLKNVLAWFSTTLRPFYPVLAVAIWWWMRLRARRRRVNGETTGQLRDVIKERDERIVQLLQQIAQMNELLIKHHTEMVSRR
ncbi:unnamed protein product [Brassica rapa]|uniref:Uncharacterized protein n=1 Tax=Brassica campestris TaxID=3711 RepID=A0A3P5ZDE0_BRACM|nr:unnamed protein product [Brassica rapa]VDC78476.1 unnamed protein product [Brassica rapa]